MLLVKDHLNLLSAQYLVHCLDTENVCHHITTMDHEMKDTLFTRHNQTVVPLLANTKKASLQTIHSSFVNTAIDNMTDNRVLNNWPPPINDEETYLTTRQRANLLQLRPLQALELLQKETEADCFFKLFRLWNGSAGCSSLVQHQQYILLNLKKQVEFNGTPTYSVIKYLSVDQRIVFFMLE